MALGSGETFLSIGVSWNLWEGYHWEVVLAVEEIKYHMPQFIERHEKNVCYSLSQDSTSVSQDAETFP